MNWSHRDETCCEEYFVCMRKTKVSNQSALTCGLIKTFAFQYLDCKIFPLSSLKHFYSCAGWAVFGMIGNLKGMFLATRLSRITPVQGTLAVLQFRQTTCCCYYPYICRYYGINKVRLKCDRHICINKKLYRERLKYH